MVWPACAWLTMCCSDCFPNATIELRLEFPYFWCLRGRKPPCWRALDGRVRGICLLRHNSLMHALNVFMMS